MEENVFKKTMPFSHEAEQSVIGAMIMDKEAIFVAMDALRPEDFYEKEFMLMYQAIADLAQAGKAVDMTTVIAKLREMEVAPELCGMEHIRQVIDATPTSANIKHYVDIVSSKSLERKLIKTLETLRDKAFSDNCPIDELLEDTEKEVFQIVQNRGSAEFEDIKQIVYRTLKNIESAAKNNSRITGIATGLRDLDAKLAGFQKSDLILLAARPSMGKTALALNIANYVAVRSHIPTVIFSLEMSKESLVKRIMSMNSRVSSETIRTGQLKDNEWADLIEASRDIGESGLIIDDTPGIKVSELRSKCRKLKLEKNIGLVMIDYLQLMSGSGHSESRQNEVAEISRSLKALAREIDCPVLALSQLSRAVESRDNKRPMLSDLRESGSIEQDADVVMFIYRDEYYNKDTEKPGVAEIIVGKQRNGPTGTVDVKWIGEMQKFATLEKAPRHDDEE
ncbi:MAG: replicative DNA helicase [Lachnospiraceae bacterium]|nr:replicative DNA helicase [Lachnospiraceae bacterium]